MSDSLLPPNATPLELALEASTCRPQTILNQTLWRPGMAPAAFLPWLAHSLSVDTWEPDWTDETRRRVIASSVSVHRRKGTRASIKAALEAAGFPGAVLVEGYGAERYDGITTHDGAEIHGSPASWAEYSVFLPRAITLEQAAQVRRILTAVAPARCRLAFLDFQEAANLYDDTILNDGTYSHGAA